MITSSTSANNVYQQLAQAQQAQAKTNTQTNTENTAPPSSGSDKVTISEQGKAASEAQTWKDIGEKYDVKNMSFNDLHNMLTELHDSDLIKTRDFLNMQLRMPAERTAAGMSENRNMIDIWQGRYDFAKSRDNTQRAEALLRQLNILKKVDSQ